jgi:hypothetical protein
VLKQLKKLVKPLLKRVLSMAIGRLPAPLQPAARKLAASFASVKFPGRAPQGQFLVRVFVGGAMQPTVMIDLLFELARAQFLEPP